MDARMLVREWSESSVRDVSSPGNGSNNDVLRVTTDDGVFYLHRHLTPEQAQRFALVGELGSGRGLSFQLPAPLPTREGALSVALPDGFSVLTRAIPGSSASVPSAAQLRAAGAALAELNAAFADAPIRGSEGWFGSLGTEQRRIAQLQTLAHCWTLTEEEQAEFSFLLAEAARKLDDGYESLLRQPIHADFDPSNVLFVGDNVSGVLDFEFLSDGPRIADVAVAVGSFASDGRGVSAERTASIIAGYVGAGGQLTAAEMAAIPQMLVLREVASLLHRHAQGCVDLAVRARRMIQVGAWLPDPWLAATPRQSH